MDFVEDEQTKTRQDKKFYLKKNPMGVHEITNNYCLWNKDEKSIRNKKYDYLLYKWKESVMIIKLTDYKLMDNNIMNMNKLKQLKYNLYVDVTNNLHLLYIQKSLNVSWDNIRITKLDTIGWFKYN